MSCSHGQAGSLKAVQQNPVTQRCREKTASYAGFEICLNVARGLLWLAVECPHPMSQPTSVSKSPAMSELVGRPHSAQVVSARHIRANGWTLFEAGLTASVIAVLALGTTAWAQHSSIDQKSASARHSAQTIHAAALEWQKDGEKSGCPTFVELVHEHYLKTTDTSADPWGERFRIHCESTEISVYSAGADGALRTADDVRFPR